MELFHQYINLLMSLSDSFNSHGLRLKGQNPNSLRHADSTVQIAELKKKKDIKEDWDAVIEKQRDKVLT